LLLVAAMGFGPVACDSACTDLNKTICSCEPNETRQRACLERVSAGSKSVDAAGLEACENLIDTCNCAALADGNLAACGLAKETAD